MTVIGLPLVGIQVDGLAHRSGIVLYIEESVIPGFVAIRTEVNGVVGRPGDDIVVTHTIGIPGTCVALHLELRIGLQVERDHVLTLSLGVSLKTEVLLQAPVVHRTNQIVVQRIHQLVGLTVHELQIVRSTLELSILRTLAVAEADHLGSSLGLEGERVDTIIARIGNLPARRLGTLHKQTVLRRGGQVRVVVACLGTTAPDNSIDLRPGLVRLERHGVLLPVPLTRSKHTVSLTVLRLAQVTVHLAYGSNPVQINIILERDVLSTLVGTVVNIANLLPGILTDWSGLDEAGEVHVRAALGKRGLVDGQLTLDILQREPLALRDIKLRAFPCPDSKVTVIGLPLVGIQVDGLGCRSGILLHVDDIVVPVVTTTCVGTEVDGVAAGCLNLEVGVLAIGIPHISIALHLELGVGLKSYCNHVLALSLGIGLQLVLLSNRPVIHRTNQVVLGVVEYVGLTIHELQVIGLLLGSTALAVAEADESRSLLGLERIGVDTVLQGGGNLCAIALRTEDLVTLLNGEAVVEVSTIVALPYKGVHVLPALVRGKRHAEVLPIPLGGSKQAGLLEHS